MAGEVGATAGCDCGGMLAGIADGGCGCSIGAGPGAKAEQLPCCWSHWRLQDPLVMAW